jgi:hypothetical protein
MRKRIWGLFAVAVSATASCAIGPTLQDRSASVPPPDPEKARVFIYRLPQFWESMVQPRIIVAGSFVGDATPRAVRYIDLPAGYRCISVERSWAMANEVSPSICVGMRAGETHYVRIDLRKIDVLQHRYYRETLRNGSWVKVYDSWPDPGPCPPRGGGSCEEFVVGRLRAELGTVDANAGKDETRDLVLLDLAAPGS